MFTIKLSYRRTPLLVAGGTQGGDLGFKVVKRLEAPVHGREPEIGHLIERPQRPEYGQADFV